MWLDHPNFHSAILALTERRRGLLNHYLTATNSVTDATRSTRKVRDKVNAVQTHTTPGGKTPNEFHALMPAYYLLMRS